MHRFYNFPSSPSNCRFDCTLAAGLSVTGVASVLQSFWRPVLKTASPRKYFVTDSVYYWPLMVKHLLLCCIVVAASRMI